MTGFNKFWYFPHYTLTSREDSVAKIILRLIVVGSCFAFPPHWGVKLLSCDTFALNFSTYCTSKSLLDELRNVFRCVAENVRCGYQRGTKMSLQPSGDRSQRKAQQGNLRPECIGSCQYSQHTAKLIKLRSNFFRSKSASRWPISLYFIDNPHFSDNCERGSRKHHTEERIHRVGLWHTDQSVCGTRHDVGATIILR